MVRSLRWFQMHLFALEFSDESLDVCFVWGLLNLCLFFWILDSLPVNHVALRKVLFFMAFCVELT